MELNEIDFLRLTSSLSKCASHCVLLRIRDRRANWSKGAGRVHPGSEDLQQDELRKHKTINETHRAVDVVIVSQRVVKALQHHAYHALGSAKPVRGIKRVLWPVKKRLSYPWLAASKGLHFPSGERIPPWEKLSQSENLVHQLVQREY